jgi:DNA (cytosine-5)-methyltransferase 1
MKTIDLFAGCGGLSLGFQKAGYDVVAAFDYWKPAIDVYRMNFKDHPIFEYDLSNVTNCDDFKKFSPDIIVGGPPCQDFSSAGKRDENLGRGDLTLAYAQIIESVRPEWFLMENVERITKTQILQKAIKVYKQAGYGLSYRVLDASYCGVPQTRKRFFLVGHLHSSQGFLDSYLSKNLSPTQMTIYDYLGDSLGLTYYYRHPRSYMRRGVFSIYEPSPTIRGVNRPVPKGYQRHPGDACDAENLRPLTTIERSYLQTFPKNFKFVGNKTDLEQMIGNAVPVNLAEYVAKALRSYMVDNGVRLKYPDQNSQSQLEIFKATRPPYDLLPTLSLG